MCLAKIGPNAGPGFQGGLHFVQQLMGRLRGSVAAPALAGEVQLVQFGVETS